MEKLGKLVCDLVTGLEGVATSHHIQLNGNVQYGITPKAEKANTMPETNTFDDCQVSVLGNGGITLPAPGISRLELGEWVEDEITGVRGTVIEKVTFMNGCLYAVVSPRLGWLARLLGETRRPDAAMYPEGRLRPLRSPSPEPENLEPEPEPKKRKKATPGGPSRRVTRG